MTTVERPSFGRVEQRELEYMRLLRFNPLDRLLFAVLKVRYDARSGTVTDRIATLAKWAGLSERRVQASLRSLAESGVVIRAKHPGAGGPRGHAWSWSTTVRHYSDWPAEPLERLIAVTISYLRTFHRAVEEHASPALSPGKSTHQRVEEHAPARGRGRTATRDNPASSLDTSQERDALFEECEEDERADDRSSPLGTRWIILRGDAGLRFADPTAARWLEAGAAQALRNGCTDEDIEGALLRHSEEAFADTRNFAKWAAAERDERLRDARDRERSRLFLEQREREEADARRDADLRARGLLPPLPRPSWMGPAVEAR